MIGLWEDAASGVRVVRLTEDEEIETLIRLFENVAQAEGWQPAGALRQWLPHSVYFALYVEGKVAGGLQLVLPDAEGTLPCQTLWPDVAVAPVPACAHIAILALDEVYRGQGLLFWRLVVEMWRHCMGEGITTLFLEVTPRVLPLYRRLGWPLVLAGELRPHWGEECFLARLSVPDVAHALLLRAERSGYYQTILAQAFRVTLRDLAIGTDGVGDEEEAAVPSGAEG